MATRRTLDETRTLLIEAGAALLAERGIVVGLEDISMIDVCREAGLSTAGSAYKIWDNQQQFRTDVLRHLIGFATPDRAPEERVAGLAASALGAMTAPQTFLRHAANATIQHWRADTTNRLVYLTLLLASRNDDELAVELHDHDTASLDAHASIYEAITRHYGRTWTAPYDASMLATVLAALLEGLAIRARYVPEAVDIEILRPTGPHGALERWSLYACAVQALTDGFTHPIEADDPVARTAVETELVDAAHINPNPSGDDTEPHARTPDRSRRSLSETRELLLATATRMLIASGMAVTIGVVDLDEVSRHAGLTSAGSAYKIWQTKDEYRTDLVRHLLKLAIPGNETVGNVHETIDDAAPATLAETVRRTAPGDLRANAEAPVFTTYLGLWLAGHHDPIVAAQLGDFERDSLETFAELYEFGRGVFNRQWLAPFTADHIAVLLSSLVQGLAIRSVITPERVPTELMRPTGPNGEMQPWHLFACATQMLFEAFSEPDELTGRDRPMT